MTQFDEAPREQVGRTNKLKGITEIVLSLDELDNTDNLENGEPSSTLLAYHVTAHDNFTNFVKGQRHKGDQAKSDRHSQPQ